MTDSRRVKGARGEEIAARYLSSLGYEILHRNLRLSRYEIDLVCRDDNCLVLVEVKSSSTDDFGHPATWIDERKREKLRQAAELYMEKFNVSGMDIRFDAVTISHGELEYFKNAF